MTTRSKEKKTQQPLGDTRWQHKMLDEPAVVLLALVNLVTHPLILFDLIHLN